MWTMTTEDCKPETDNLWFSSITCLPSHLLRSKPTVPCASYRKYFYLVLYMQRQCPVRQPPSAAVHTQHRLLIYYGKFLRRCLKIFKTKWQNHIVSKYNSHEFFLETLQMNICIRGKEGRYKQLCDFQYKHWLYSIWSHWMDQTSIKQFLKELQVVRDYYICVRNHYVYASCEFHAALFHYTHIVKLIPTYAAYNNVLFFF